MTDTADCRAMAAKLRAHEQQVPRDTQAASDSIREAELAELLRRR